MYEDKKMDGLDLNFCNPTFQTTKQINLVSECKIPGFQNLSGINEIKSFHGFSKIKKDPFKINFAKSSDVELNYDPSPLIIRKKPTKPISYTQNVSIKFLKPLTPPPVG
jgi:hypothetical protein